MQKSHSTAGRKGFTLIELLIVIGIIGFLAAAVLVAVDPVKRIQSSRDSQRWSEVDATLNAILKWQVDNLGEFGGVASVAQVDTITVTALVASATYTVTINGDGTPSSFTADGSPTNAEVVGGLISAINADGDVNAAVTAGNESGATFTVTSDVPGQSFTTAVGSNLSFVNTVANSLGAPIDTIPGSVQVIVSSATGVDCQITAQSPACPSASPALITGTTLDTECVANIVGLVPEYLSEIPIDPNDGTTPTAGNLAIGTNNTGYYINKNASGRITIGACYPEQETSIRVQR